MVTLAHIDPDQLLLDTLRLGKKVYETGFRPKHAVSIWRGGTPIGLGVDAYFRGHGVYLNHTTIATESYTGIGRQEEVIVRGLEHVIKVICPEDGLLIIDDVYESGRTIQKIAETLRRRARRNAPREIVVATVHSKPEKHVYSDLPVVCLEEMPGDVWIDYPHELADLWNAEDHGEAVIRKKDADIWRILSTDRFEVEQVHTDESTMYVSARELLHDAFKLGVNIMNDESFFPDFLIALWPGGVTAGLPVHEVIKYLGKRRGDPRKPDHISINTTRSHVSYKSNIIGVRYLEENVEAHSKVLIIDTTFRSGRMVNDVITKLKTALRRNLSHKRIRVASIYHNPGDKSTWTTQPMVTEPHYYVKQVNADVIYPWNYYRLPNPRADLARHAPRIRELVYG